MCDTRGMTPWRERCEQTLRVQTRADANRFWGLARADLGPGTTSDGTDGAGEGREVIAAPPFDYRFEHTLAVVKLARWLAPMAQADPEVVECAAWLHDCRKALAEPRARDHHARDASEAVAGILAGSDFPAAKVPAVRHAIEHHVGLELTHRLEPVATACLWDCDKLSKLGAASLVHYGCIAPAFRPVDTAGILDRGLAWLELARGIVRSMNTQAGREEAERRLAFLETHYGQLRREWSDPMEASRP